MSVSAAAAGWMVYWFSLAFTTFPQVCDGYEDNTVTMYLVADISRIVISVALLVSLFVHNAVNPSDLHTNVTIGFACWALLVFMWSIVWLAVDVENETGDCLAMKSNSTAWKIEVEDKIGVIDSFGSKSIYNMALMHNPKNWCRNRLETMTGKKNVGLQSCLRYHSGDFVSSTKNAITIDVVFDLVRLIGFLMWYFDIRDRQPESGNTGQTDQTGAAGAAGATDVTGATNKTGQSHLLYPRPATMSNVLRQRRTDTYRAVPTSPGIQF